RAPREKPTLLPRPRGKGRRIVDENERGDRGIVRRKLARDYRTRPSSLRENNVTKYGQLLGRDGPSPKQFHTAVTYRHDRRLNSMQGGSGIDDEWNSSPEFIENMLRGGRTDAAKTICARRRQREIDFPDDFGEDRVRTNSNRDCIETGGRNVGNYFLPRQNQREGPGPELRSQLLDQAAGVVVDPRDAFQPIR